MVNVIVRKSPTVIVNQAGKISRKLSDLIDVDVSTKTDGSILIYNENQSKFVASTLLEKQEINGGHF
jgi:hypothetical protein